MRSLVPPHQEPGVSATSTRTATSPYWVTLIALPARLRRTCGSVRRSHAPRQATGPHRPSNGSARPVAGTVLPVHSIARLDLTGSPRSVHSEDDGRDGPVLGRDRDGREPDRRPADRPPRIRHALVSGFSLAFRVSVPFSGSRSLASPTSKVGIGSGPSNVSLQRMTRHRSGPAGTGRSALS